MKTCSIQLLKHVTIVDQGEEKTYRKGTHHEFPANSAAYFVKWGLAVYVGRPAKTA